MSARKEAINKISRPRLSVVYARTRLFGLLDENRRHPAIWISGPAGAGKTTLIAHYLERRDLGCLWYQIDPRDGDPATFFYFMGLAVKQASPRKRQPLPLLTPEFMPGIDTFALRYFEEVFQRLPPPMMLVIDNYQLLPAESILHALIGKALAVVPDGMTVVMVSREHPPPVYSRMLANRRMAHIGWQQVRLVKEEAAGIACLQTDNSISEATIQNLHEVTGGWAAGLMLMLAQPDREEIDWQRVRGYTLQEITDYFAKEVFEGETPEIQDFLLRASFLPHMTIAMAEALTGCPRAGQILLALNRGNHFTERRLRKRVSYQFHPLFRGFLRSRSERVLDDLERGVLRRKAAALLEDEGDPEAAAVLLRDAGAWGALADLILKHAPILVSQGRNMLVAEWIDGLHDEVVQKSGWLLYWGGACRTGCDLVGSRRFLEPAYQIFREQQDAVGIARCWCALETVYFLECAEYAPLDKLIEDAFSFLPDIVDQLPLELAAVLGFHIFSALNMRQPHHPQIENYALQVDQMIDLVPDIGQRLLIGSRLVIYQCMQGKLRPATRLIHLLGPQARKKSVAPFPVLGWLCAEATHAYTSGAFNRCLQIVAKGEDITCQTGILVTQGTLLSMGAYALMRQGKYDRAREYLDRMDRAILPGRFFEYALHRIQAALCLALQGKLGQAMASARAALDLALRSGSPLVEIMCRFGVGQLHTDLGAYPEAVEALESAGSLGQASHSPLAAYTALMFKAQLQFAQGNGDAGTALLRDGLALGRKNDYCVALWDRHDVIADLYVKALEADIETDYVRETIRRTGLVPAVPPATVESWPWPLKVYTLGRFSLVKEDEPIQFSTKAQKRPLELVKVLIALGGRDVNKELISDILWPDADGDKADRAFATTLHRLRRLLGNDMAVQIQDGRLTLNPACCWVDCWAFERGLSQAKLALSTEDVDTAAEVTAKALDLYKGAFLAGDEQASWTVSARERLRSKFLRAVDRIGRELISIGQWDRALRFFQRALDVDDLAEESYRRLMQCLQRSGRRTEALSVYRRCKHTLNAAFGLDPSPETQAIYRSLVEGP